MLERLPSERLVSEPIGYTEASGIAPLRRAIAAHYQAQYGVMVDPGEVVVTTGSSAAFLLAFLAAFEPGDRVGLAIPGYPAYRNILSALGIEPVLIAVGENAHYQPTPELLADVGRLDGLVVASPANPTGTMIGATESGSANSLLPRAEASGWSPTRSTTGSPTEPPRRQRVPMGARRSVVNSFSKYYSMTGWRLGWMLVPPDLARSVECLAQNFYISPPALSQIAALPVFGCRVELDSHVERYRTNRDLLIGALGAAGLTRFAPAEGAFYLYVDISSLTRDSEEFCRRLLAETGVAVTPGLDFDPVDGGGWVRLSFAGSTDSVAEAARRLKAWLQQVRQQLVPADPQTAGRIAASLTSLPTNGSNSAKFAAKRRVNSRAVSS